MQKVNTVNSKLSFGWKMLPEIFAVRQESDSRLSSCTLSDGVHAANALKKVNLEWKDLGGR